METQNSDPTPPPVLLCPDEATSPDSASLTTQLLAGPAADASEPTDSHALASQTSVHAEHRETLRQESEYGEVLDLGWNDDDKSALQPIVQGLDNEQLWALLRRFNKQAFRVRRVEQPPLANLDMNIADEDDFSPEKLRAHLERGYVSAVVPLCAAWNHVVRLRSWNERNRTLLFLLFYACSWMLDLLVPTTVLFVILLILAPDTRKLAFPPAPLSLIDSSTGNPQTPPTGHAATDDTLTGAPEKVAGEAVEQEAHSFVNTLGSVSAELVVSEYQGNAKLFPTLQVALSTTIGGPASDNTDDVSAAPGADDLIENVSEAKASARGDERKAQDKTRKPASKMVWQRTRPFMHAVTDIADTAERLANALDPTPPFPRRRPRARLAAALLPVAVASLCTTPYMLTKSTGLVLGFVLFGKPLLDRLIQMVETTYPRWQRFVELRHSLLRGVPTNAQLTITLLRIGEKNKAPIPAPPDPDVVARKKRPAQHDDVRTKDTLEEEDGEKAPGQAAKRPGKGRRALDVLKGAVKGGVTTALLADRAKALVGAPHAKQRVGVVTSPSPHPPPVGPVRFEARFHGKRGYAYITETATTPALSWSPDGGSPAWSVLVSEVSALRKVGGFAWPSKMVVGWSLHKEMLDGLVVETREGREYHLTAVMVRDEIFNRLVAMGDQMWQLG